MMLSLALTQYLLRDLPADNYNPFQQANYNGEGVHGGPAYRPNTGHRRQADPDHGACLKGAKWLHSGQRGRGR